MSDITRTSKTMLQGNHPRGSNDTRGELELCLRDAFAAGCEAVSQRSLFTAMDYAAREAPIVAERIRAAEAFIGDPRTVVCRPSGEPEVKCECPAPGTSNSSWSPFCHVHAPAGQYTIEPHGDGHALYSGRDQMHHGFNLAYITEAMPETLQLIERALNAGASQPPRAICKSCSQEYSLSERHKCPGLQPARPPSPLAKVAAAFAGKVKDSYILKLWFESQEDLDAAFDMVDDVNPILPIVPDSDPTKDGGQ